MGIGQQLSETFVEQYLGSLRSQVKKEGLDLARMPGWMRAARVRTGFVGNVLAFAAEESAGGQDEVRYMGQVGADSVVFMDLDDFHPSGAGVVLKSGKGFITIVGVDKEGRLDPHAYASIRISADAALTSAGLAEHECLCPLLFHVVLILASREGHHDERIRLLPFAGYVPECRLCSQDTIGAFVNTVMEHLRASEKALGDYWARKTSELQVFTATKARTVVVLGTDTGNELSELQTVRANLHLKGYESHLIKELAEIPASSNAEKVRLWCLASRFSIMVDRKPGGHLLEFEILRANACILVVLRPKNSGSSWMMHADASQKHIRFIEFDGTPLDVIDQAVSWAEACVKERESAYSEYPWRKGNSKQ